MSEERRTPGPWLWSEDGWLVTEGGDVVAGVGAKSIAIIVTVPADRPLIAAAPTMLEALEHVQGALDEKHVLSEELIHAAITEATEE